MRGLCPWCKNTMNFLIESGESTMQLFYSPNSPFVRKVLIVAHEAGVLNDIELLDCNAHAINRDQNIIVHNPLGQVPTLLRADGSALADSGVICEYLNDLGSGDMFPAKGDARWQALFDQAMADGLATATLTLRYETAVRPPEYSWKAWSDAHIDKINTTLDAFNSAAHAYGTRFDIGLAALTTALFYLDLRFSDLDWRQRAPSLAQWYADIQNRESVNALPT